MEMLLDPCRDNYALRGQHDALRDTKINHRLFLNQLSRVCSLDDGSYNEVSSFLPAVAVDVVNKMRSDQSWKTLASIWDSESEAFFRPIGKSKPLPKPIEAFLFNENTETLLVGVIAPTLLWDVLAASLRAYFIHDQHPLSYLIDAGKVKKTEFEDPYYAAVLLRYISLRKSKVNYPTCRPCQFPFRSSSVLTKFDPLAGM